MQPTDQPTTQPTTAALFQAHIHRTKGTGIGLGEMALMFKALLPYTIYILMI